MIIPPFSLPSRPVIKITLREATVSDLLDFADLDPGHEEEVTTLFLNRLQDKATFKDSKEWTGEDRRFGLFWYWLHTTDDCDVAISYQCGHCGEDHTFLQDYRKLGEGYISIKGMPERDIEHNGKEYMVKPLTGSDMEYLEAMRGTEEKPGTSLRAMIGLERTCRALGVKTDDLLPMACSEYLTLRDKVESSLADMRHGLDTEQQDGAIHLVLPPHPCLRNKEVTTRVRVSFRPVNLIPAL